MRWRQVSRAGTLLIAGALLLGACGTATVKNPAATPQATGGSNSITISNFMFQPVKLSVSPGATIEVTNKDSATHTVTSSGGHFTTGDIKQGQTKSFTAPTKPGTYQYICNIHQFMVGTLVVK